jgi:hypothetical protein
MGRHVSQQAFLKILSLRHTGAVCPKLCQSPKFIMSSPHLLPDFSASQSDISEKLIDKPISFWLHEQQRVSNLHRGIILKTGAFPRP